MGSGRIHAQNQPMSCPHDTASSYPDYLFNATPCLNVNELLDELDGGDQCRLIWININVHFFVTSGSPSQLITPAGHLTKEANSIAENLINDANYMLYLNEIQLNQPGSVKLCNPFQYVLKGVYIHEVTTEDEVDARFDLTNMYNAFDINKSSEFNLFISPCTNCSGVAGGLGGNVTYFNLALLQGNVLNHEWAHTMGLKHSWVSDDLSDTPEIRFEIDRNCDGDSDDANERFQQCFGKLSSLDPVTAASDNIGMSWDGMRWYNGINDCLEMAPCTINPCCSDAFQNNNVMAYNACQCSFTYLQIRRILEQLVSYKCDFINAIQTDRSCWVPSAFISFPLPNQSNYGNCSTCFDFSASYNDQKHLIKVYEILGGSSALSYNSGWINGPATKICFKNYGLANGNSRFLKPNTNYMIELNVGRTNDCVFPVTYTRYFKTGVCFQSSEDQLTNFSEMNIFPNPSSTAITLRFDAYQSEEFSVFAVNQGTNQISLLNDSFIAGSNGKIELELSISLLNSGTYTVYVIGIEHNYYKTMVKS